jgi:hypothetical protein
LKDDYFHQIKMQNLELENRDRAESEDSLSGLDSAEEFINKTVIRDRKLTEKQRELRKAGQAKQLEQKKEAKDRKLER